MSSASSPAEYESDYVGLRWDGLLWLLRGGGRLHVMLTDANGNPIPTCLPAVTLVVWKRNAL